MVRKATPRKIGRFTKQDIRELCPSLRASSIEGAPRRMAAEGEIMREGSGEAACYHRIRDDLSAVQPGS